MDNNENLENESVEAPIIEKISKSELKAELKKIDSEKPNIFTELLRVISKLSDDDAKIIAQQLDKILEEIKK